MKCMVISDLAGVVGSVAAISVASLSALTSDVPPESALPISEIAAILEERESGVLTQIEFDDQAWEAELNVGPRSGVKIYINPSDGSEIQRRDDARDEQPPSNAMALSQILKNLQDQNFGLIYEVEFDDGYWEIEAKRDGADVEIKINPMTGEPKR